MFIYNFDLFRFMLSFLFFEVSCTQYAGILYNTAVYYTCEPEGSILLERSL